MIETQCNRILDYISKYGSITPLDAMNQLGVMRLASRINDLKRKGHSIQKEMVTANNRFGEKVSFAKYKINGGDENERNGLPIK